MTRLAELLRLRCRLCGRWLGRHRRQLVGDQVTDDTCAMRYLIGQARNEGRELELPQNSVFRVSESITFEG